MANILVCDDERSICEMLDIALRREGHRVETVQSGQAAKSKIDGALYDVIITDINMPRLDGFGFIEQVRTDSRFLGVPILVLTTESSADKKSLARRAGATGWIVKPFDSTKLVDVVRRVTA